MSRVKVERLVEKRLRVEKFSVKACHALPSNKFKTNRCIVSCAKSEKHAWPLHTRTFKRSIVAPKCNSNFVFN